MRKQSTKLPIPQAEHACCMFVAIVCFLLSALPLHGQCATQELSKLVAFDANAFSRFGTALSLSGNTLAVGASTHTVGAETGAGSVYVYIFNDGAYTLQQQVIAADAAASDNFGISVAISGDTLLVGSAADDDAGPGSGSAYVFVRAAGIWTPQAKLTALDAAPADQFGWAVALEGDTAIVGAPADHHSGGSQLGSAYVFVRSGSTWSQQAKLIASDGGNFDQLGFSVALSGGRALVGAYGDDTSAGVNAGSAYVFNRSGTVWSQQQKLIAPDSLPDDRLGYSVSLSSDTAVIGSPFHDHSGLGNAGAVYVFTWSGAVWIQQAKIVASPATSTSLLGSAVAASGDVLVAGAFADDHSSLTDAGSARVFVRSNNIWYQQAVLTASDPGASDYFGRSVALGGNFAAAGADGADLGPHTDAGAAYAFTLGCDFDNDGVPNLSDACPENAPGLPICANGRPARDCNGDCLVDGGDLQCIVDEMLAN